MWLFTLNLDRNLLRGVEKDDRGMGVRSLRSWNLRNGALGVRDGFDV